MCIRDRYTDEDTLIKVFATIHGANRIFFHANGRSMLTIKYFAQRLMHQGYRVFIVGDVATPAIKKDDALVVVSASGEEKNLITAVNTVKEIGDIPVILVLSLIHIFFKASLFPPNTTMESLLPQSSRSCEISASIFP